MAFLGSLGLQNLVLMSSKTIDSLFPIKSRHFIDKSRHSTVDRGKSNDQTLVFAGAVYEACHIQES